MESSWGGVKVGVQVGGQCLGRGQGLGPRLRSRSGVKVRGQGRWVKVRVMIGGHKVGGQGQGIGNGVKSG